MSLFHQKMKAPLELPEGVQVWASLSRDSIRFQYESPDRVVIGHVRARRLHTHSHIWSVQSAHATNGYGPLLYHCMMEQLLSDHCESYLCSDRNGCSIEASRVWETFRYRCTGVTYVPVPDEIRLNVDRGYTDAQKEALNCLFRKSDRKYLQQLRELGKLVEEYKPE